MLIATGDLCYSPAGSFHHKPREAFALMGEIPLARLWQLPDGTSCMLIKDARAENWHLRVVCGDETLRSERFGSLIVAMDEAKQWRASYDRSVEASR